MTEADLYEQLARYLNLKHPGVLYHFDLAGVNNPSHKTRNLYGRLNRRAWPDLFLAGPGRRQTIASMLQGQPVFETCGRGLFLELKREGTQLKRTKDLTKLLKGDHKIRQAGDWWDVHTEEQAEVLDTLAEQGYIAQFAVGFDEACALIDSYLAAVS